MKGSGKVAFAVLILATVLSPAWLPAQQAAGQRFAVVELFTSEGCSSCPPADDVLSQLVRAADEEKLPIYALEWHVDYWDYLGWKDPWDSRFATQRQYAYARSLPSSVYTPQIVIDGRLVPSNAGDSREVTSLARSVAMRPPDKSSVSIITSRQESPTSVRVDVEVSEAPLGLTMLVALVEGTLSARPNAGENEGRSLVHSNVVRAVKVVPASSGEIALDTPPAAGGTMRRIIVLLQDSRTMRIFGAAQSELAESGAKELSGRVVDEAGNAIAGVLIQACGAALCIPGRTDRNGYFTLHGIPAGTYEVDFSLPAFTNARVRFFDHSSSITVERTVWRPPS
jgi:hypothetical protein